MTRRNAKHALVIILFATIAQTAYAQSPDDVVYGELAPDNEVVAADTCGRLSPTDYEVRLGSNGYVTDSFPHVVIAEGQRHNPLQPFALHQRMSLQLSPTGGLRLDAEFSERPGPPTISIHGSQFLVRDSEIAHLSYPNPSTLIVTGLDGDILLSLRFDNPHVITILGHMFFANEAVTIGKDATTIGQVYMANDCFAYNGVADLIVR